MNTADVQPDPFDLENFRARPEDLAVFRSRRRPATPRQRYVYYCLDADQPLPVEDLDALGDRGWRLAGMVRHGGLIHYVFVRPAAAGYGPSDPDD
jgi:hypothetical protein